jgi:hypothetical protein
MGPSVSMKCGSSVKIANHVCLSPIITNFSYSWYILHIDRCYGWVSSDVEAMAGRVSFCIFKHN